MSEDERAIALVETIAQPLPNVRITTVGLAIDSKIEFDDWANIGAGIGKGSRAFSLAAGDWLVYGEKNFPDRYSQAMDATQLSLGRLRNLASTCSRVSIETRMSVPLLSISHLESVASFPEQYQRQLLQLARDHEIDRDTFRKLTREVKNGVEPDNLELGQGGQVVITPSTSTETIIEKAKHVAVAWSNNYSSSAIGMTLHQALVELAEILGEE